MTEQRESSQQLAKALGWFSIGLGLAEVVNPRAIAGLIGVQDDTKTKNILRFYGARELAAGVGILSDSNRPAWLWARVAGDCLDLSSLFKAMVSDDNDRRRAFAATAAVLGVTIADVRCAMQMMNTDHAQARTGSDARARTESAPISSSIIIARSPEEVYAFWRDFSRLPEILDRLDSVQVIDDRRSHWKLSAPMGRTLEWDAETTADEPNTRIAWRSLSTTTPHSGEVRFEPATGQRGTKVSVEIQPAGMGGSIGKLFGLVPEQHVKIALRNLKQLLELGEVVKSDASIHRGMYPAQPPAEYPAAGEARQAAASV